MFRVRKNIIPISFILLVLPQTVSSTNVATRGLHARSAANAAMIAFSSPVFGPFAGGESVTFSWEYYSYGLISNRDVQDIFMVSCSSKSAEPFYTSTISSHKLMRNKIYNASITYKIPAKYLNTESGLVFTAALYSITNHSYLVQVNRVVKPVIPTTINPINYRVNPYTISDRTFAFDLEEPLSEKLTFDEFADYVECDSHNRLLFNSLSFKYESSLDVTNTPARIRFIDKNNVFPNMPKDGDGYTVVDAYLVQEDDRVHIKLRSLYCNPISLICSYEPVGERCDYLYVRKGWSHLIADYIFTLEVNDVGINKTSFSYDMECDLSSYYLGNCQDGDFCVIGGVKE